MRSMKAFDSSSSTYVVAELSANHRQNLSEALKLIEAAKAAGADAVKIQTYTADTITFNSDLPPFQLRGQTAWKTLHELYRQAHTPWEWDRTLKDKCREVGIDFFSTPFDETAVMRLETLDLPIYKVASFEIVDLPLLRCIGQTRKPVILSTGMATREEIAEAVQTLEEAGCPQMVLLKCTSSYPAAPEQMNLRTMVDMQNFFRRPVGLSDHTLGMATAVAAVALGAKVVEKHFILSRSAGGLDSSFSMEPSEFAGMVGAIREVEKALGSVHYGPVGTEKDNLRYRPSIFAVQPIQKGEIFGYENIKTLRPADGLPCRYYPYLIGRQSCRQIEPGTPLNWELVAGGEPGDLKTNT